MNAVAHRSQEVPGSLDLEIQAGCVLLNIGVGN